jgi:dipeptidyl aminopeptidase/acylaminoacyl peptidase
MPGAERGGIVSRKRRCSMRRFGVLGAGLAVFVCLWLSPPLGMQGALSSGAPAVTGEVAYTRVQGESLWITVADLAGKGRHEITRPLGKKASWFDHSPAWSPDGSRVAFLREGRTGSGLYVASRDGSGLRRVLRLPNNPDSDAEFWAYDASDFAWSPDGKSLAFASGLLYVVSADGTNSRKLPVSSACKPSWSPNGRSLLYLRDRVFGCGYRGGNEHDPGHKAIYRIDTDGSHSRLLARGSFGDASWSPDGRQIAITDGCSVAHGGDWFCSVSVVKADGSGKQRLVKDSFGGGWVQWTAGGTEVLWPSYPTFQATNVATGKTHKVLPAPYKEGDPVGISASGQMIAVLAMSSYEMAESHPVPPLLIVTASGRLVQRVTVPPGWRSAWAGVYVR